MSKGRFTDKYRKRMKNQATAKTGRKNERERRRREAEVRRVPPTRFRPAYPAPELIKDIFRRRIRDLLVKRIRSMASETDYEGIRSILKLWISPMAFPLTHIIFEEEPAPAAATEVLLLPEGRATAASPVCPLCDLPITPEHYKYNVKEVKFQGRPVLVHKVCPNEPGYVWLREGSPGSGRFA